MTRIIIDNVKDEFIPAFKGLAKGTNATFKAESSDVCDYGYSHEPNDETIRALKECESGEGGKVYANYADFLKEIEIELANEAKF